MKLNNSRQLWQEHIKTVKKKLQRKDKTITHKAAMSEASKSWPSQKIKLLRKQKRQTKKKAKEVQNQGIVVEE